MSFGRETKGADRVETGLGTIGYVDLSPAEKLLAEAEAQRMREEIVISTGQITFSIGEYKTNPESFKKLNPVLAGEYDKIIEWETTLLGEEGTYVTADEIVAGYKASGTTLLGEILAEKKIFTDLSEKMKNAPQTLPNPFGFLGNVKMPDIFGGLAGSITGGLAGFGLIMIVFVVIGIVLLVVLR